MRALLFISGILSLILGLFAISGVWRSVEILAIFIGIAFLFRGFGMLFESAERSGGRGWNIFGGIVMLIGGFVVLVWPGISLVTLAWVAGIWLVVGGIFEIIARLQAALAGEGSLSEPLTAWLLRPLRPLTGGCASWRWWLSPLMGSPSPNWPQPSASVARSSTDWW